MLKGLTNTFKNNCNATEVVLSEYLVLGSQTIPIKAELSDDCYENGNFIGTFILKSIKFETDATYDFKDKEFEYYKTINNESIKIGTFITTEVTINDTTELVSVVGMDYGLKTQVEYTSSLDYASGEITLKDVWDEACTLSGLESGITYFPNSDFIVDSDQFTGTGATIRDVFKGIAMSSGTFVKVMNDDKIYLVFNELTSELKNLEINESTTIQDGYKLNSLELNGNTTQDGTPTPSSPVDIEVVTGRQTFNTCKNNLAEFGTQKDTTKYTYNSFEANNIDVEKTATGGSFYASYILHIPSAGTYRFKGTILYRNQQFYIYSDKLFGNKIKDGTFSKGTITYSYVFEKAGDYILGFYGSTLENYGVQNFMCVSSSMSTINYESYIGENYEINLGKNLFNYNDLVSKIQTFTTTGNQKEFTITGYGTYDYPISLKGQHTISGNWSTTNLNGHVRLIYEDDTNTNLFSSYTSTEKTGTISVTTTKNVKAIRFQTYNTSNIIFTDFQIEKGSIATSYSSYFTPIELCEIGDYKDRIYKSSGKWYLENKHSKIDSYNGETITTDYISTTGGLDTGATIYYGVETTISEITNTELISQLESIELLEGINNITISSNNLPSPLKITYYNNELDIIEDYTELKDKRDTHPWTCLRLGMSQIDGENVDYIDEDLVAEYGENWLILNDNPFAYNQTKRQQLIMTIFNQIKEFGYSSFVSNTSFKPYLTCGDIIKFKNRNGDLVKSIVLRYNHNGEEITLEAPSETSATVSYIYPLSAIDIAKRTQIEVDKEQGQITSLVETTTQLNRITAQNTTDINNNYQEIIEKFNDVASTDDVTQLRQAMQTTMNEQELRIENIQSIVDNGVEKVSTTSGTFDENGLTMEKTGAKTKGVFDESGLDIQDAQGSSNQDLLFAGYVDSEKAQSNEDLTPYEGQTIVYTKNIIVKNYLTIGTHSRIEDFEDGTGVFYIGG